MHQGFPRENITKLAIRHGGMIIMSPSASVTPNVFAIHRCSYYDIRGIATLKYDYAAKLTSWL